MNVSFVPSVERFRAISDFDEKLVTIGPMGDIRWGRQLLYLHVVRDFQRVNVGTAGGVLVEENLRRNTEAAVYRVVVPDTRIGAVDNGISVASRCGALAVRRQ
jgi:hypothetical protein